ncbi:MAG: prepilin-type N-terminal cleavage/methylation domain-containing protein [Microgenomates group bacterium]
MFGFKGNNNNKGFSLIELLVVISIIGVLAALLLANLVGVRGRASDTSLKNDMRQLKTALSIYYNDHQVYPSNGSVFPVGSAFTGTGSTVYIREVPQYDGYTQTSGGDGFLLWVILENVSDSDIADTVSRCNVASPAPGAYYVCED